MSPRLMQRIDAPATASAPWLSRALAEAIEVCATVMMFLRCRGGVSHSPAESITEADALSAVAALRRFAENFRVPA